MALSTLLETGGFNQLARTRDGYLLYNRNDIYVGGSVEKYGEFSKLEMDLLAQLINENDFVFEVGANIGTHTVAIAAKVGPYGRVVAFEPQRVVFQTLCANVALNSLTNVDCHWAALGREPGVITVPELDPARRANFGGVSLFDWPAGQPVERMVLDRFVNVPRLRLLKIDVEGMESEVLGGAGQLIDKFKPILYVENDRIDKSEALIRQIAAMGYRLYWHLPPLYNPENFYGNADNAFPGIVSVNMLCIHRDMTGTIEGFTEIVDPGFHPFRR